MLKKSVVILGDSTSMSVGAERKTYPFLLADKKIWDKNTVLVNCSLPGFTSCDMATFFFKNLESFGEIMAVIIYPGNCDTMSSELPRPKYTKWHSFKSWIFRNRKKNIRLENKLLNFEWNNDFDSQLSKSTPIGNFYYNLEKILKYCKKRSIRTILINPIANRDFPPGSASGNFIFYHYYNIEDKLSHKFSISDSRFTSAYKKFEKKEYASAASAYKEILLNPGSLSDNIEFESLVVSNYAVCQAKLGYYSEAKYLLQIAKDSPNARKEIILYNIALIERDVGNSEKYNYYLNESYQSDKFMYRVRQKYHDQINKLYPTFCDAYLDLDNVCDDKSFVDHCHLLPEFHEKIAQFIIEELGLVGSRKSLILNKLFNPEYSLGNEKRFEDYFKILADNRTSEIGALVDFIGSDDKGVEDIDNAYLRSSLSNIQRHPIFCSLDYVKDEIEPECRSDYGRFSELFPVRFLIPYVKHIEGSHSLSRVFFEKTTLLRTSEELVNILPKSSRVFVRAELSKISPDHGSKWVGLILERVYTLTDEHLTNGSQVDDRLKTTIFWYLREVLRFGSHSRISMMYDRMLLENIFEALAFSAVISETYLERRFDNEIVALTDSLIEIVDVHDLFCSKIASKPNDAEIIKEYNSQLREIKTKINKIRCIY